jgi:hypothetical protein
MSDTPHLRDEWPDLRRLERRVLLCRMPVSLAYADVLKDLEWRAIPVYVRDALSELEWEHILGRK